MDHFWIILGPFSTILLTVLSTLCQWSCGFVHLFLEAKLVEQVNLHFWIIYNTRCWFICCFVLALCHTYVWKLRFWIMNRWIISFLELTFLRITFFPHKLVDHFFFVT